MLEHTGERRLLGHTENRVFAGCERNFRATKQLAEKNATIGTNIEQRNVSSSKEIGIPCPGSHHWSCVGYGGWSVFKNRFNDY
jgi:hypothetical protein